MDTKSIWRRLALIVCLAGLTLFAIPSHIPAQAAGTGLTPRGQNLTLDAPRGPILAGLPAAPDAPTASWSALQHNGLYDSVEAMAASGMTLYVGGLFKKTADGSVTNLNNIARYTCCLRGSGWSALPNNGLNGMVLALAVSGTTLYAGGRFTATADGSVTNLNHIAKYDATTNKWSALAHGGVQGDVWALAVRGSTLYVGGEFSATADGSVTNLNNIAKYNLSTNKWSALAHKGLNFKVRTLVTTVNATTGAVILYAGGDFLWSFDGQVQNLDGVAKYDTSTNTWSALAHKGVNGWVNTLAMHGTQLYVGGYFQRTADGVVNGLNCIATYNTSTKTWSALAHQGLSDGVWKISAYDTLLYVGGYFTQTFDGGVAGLNNIAMYDTTAKAWSALPHQGLNLTVRSLAISRPTLTSPAMLYVGGDFWQSFDGSMSNLYHIARYQ